MPHQMHAATMRILRKFYRCNVSAVALIFCQLCQSTGKQRMLHRAVKYEATKWRQLVRPRYVGSS
jgi:hypothetical protein